MPIQNIFINELNKANYKKAALEYIYVDFKKRGNPAQHFWYDKVMIGKAFDDCTAMVATNDKKEIVGYMVWSRYDGGLELDIAEVRGDYRRQGVLKSMLKDLSDKFTDVSVLSGSVLPQSEKIFDRVGWEKISVCNYGKLRTKYFKIIRPVLPILDALPDGRVIAIFSKIDDAIDSKEHIDFYTVQAHLEKYKIKYFQIDLDENGQLRVPIVTGYHNEGFVGVYFNRELMATGKAKQLFVNQPSVMNLLVINKIVPLFDYGIDSDISKIIPCDRELFEQKGFFPKLQPEATASLSPAETVDDIPAPKRPRIEATPAILQPPQLMINTSISSFSLAGNIWMFTRPQGEQPIISVVAQTFRKGL